VEYNATFFNYAPGRILKPYRSGCKPGFKLVKNLIQNSGSYCCTCLKRASWGGPIPFNFKFIKGINLPIIGNFHMVRPRFAGSQVSFQIASLTCCFVAHGNLSCCLAWSDKRIDFVFPADTNPRFAPKQFNIVNNVPKVNPLSRKLSDDFPL
jgi:hypothetical protein